MLHLVFFPHLGGRPLRLSCPSPQTSQSSHLIDIHLLVARSFPSGQNTDISDEPALQLYHPRGSGLFPTSRLPLFLPAHTMLAFIVFLFIATAVWALKSLRSPIARIPGPTHNVFTSFYLKYKEFSRQRRVYIHDLHQSYGPVVRLGPKEVSFATADAVKEIYQSGGSGYDRTEFYDLFKQFGTRTLFSTLPKAGHSQRKRILADKYANTNVMRPEHLQGLKDRAQTLLHNCTSTSDGEVDAYVQLHCFALDGASQFLLHPNGTRSLSDPHDLEMMEELTYHDSLKRKYWRPQSVDKCSHVQRISCSTTLRRSLQSSRECQDRLDMLGLQISTS